MVCVAVLDSPRENQSNTKFFVRWCQLGALISVSDWICVHEVACSYNIVRPHEYQRLFTCLQSCVEAELIVK